MQTDQIQIAGMSCGGCTNKVAHALQSISGVIEVKVSLTSGKATVKYDEEVVAYEQLLRVVQESGYNASPHGARKQTKTHGCCCR